MKFKTQDKGEILPFFICPNTLHPIEQSRLNNRSRRATREYKSPYCV